MPRIDRQSWEAASFPVIGEIPTRYDDLDAQGHINNAAGIVILQEARVRFHKAAGLPSLARNFRVMVAAIAVEYAAELYHPAPVIVHSAILSISRTSFKLAQLVRQNGKTGIYAQTVTVLADAQGPTPIPQELREAFERLSMT